MAETYVSWFISLGFVGDREAGARSTNLVQGHQRRAGSHLRGLGAWVYSPFRIRVYKRLLHLRCLPAGCSVHRRRLGSDLDLGRRRRAWQPGRARRQRHRDVGLRGYSSERKVGKRRRSLFREDYTDVLSFSSRAMEIVGGTVVVCSLVPGCKLLI
jgi:hypothetical protein